MKIIEWIIFSSKNADKISLTVKGFLVGVASMLVILFPGADFSPLVDSIAIVVQQGLALISVVMVMWGAVRKVYRTIVGTNKVSIE